MTTTMALQQKISEEEEEVVVVAEEKLAQKHVPLYWLGVALCGFSLGKKCS